LVECECAKCGTKLPFYKRAFDSEKAYYTGFLRSNIPLNIRYPNNPYKGKYLCVECYKEVYENGPPGPPGHGKKSFDDKSSGAVEKASSTSDAHSEMISASAILSDSSIFKDVKDRYLVIYDPASKGLKFNNLNKAINVMAEKGWKCVSITNYNTTGEAGSAQGIHMYALMEKIN